MVQQGTRPARIAGLATLLLLGVTPVVGDAREAHRMSGRPPGKPAYLWLWYPEQGSDYNTDLGPYCSNLTPTPYSCTFGPTVEDCKRQIQAYLDLWYADFNLVFTFTRPNADYYKMVITSDGGWCPHESTEGEVAGLAFSSGCNDITGYSGYALECGDSAHDCAVVIAHEHAHMVGLEHTDSITDIMNRRVQAKADGFDNQENMTVDDTCDYLTQNSYQRMIDVLGPWPGGAKPSPFASTPDAGVRDAATEAPIDSTRSSGTVGPGLGPTIDGGTIIAIGGYDALSRPPLPSIDASRSNGGSAHQGCSVSGRPASFALLAVTQLSLLALAFIRRRAHRARRVAEPPPCAAPGRSPAPGPTRGQV